MTASRPPGRAGVDPGADRSRAPESGVPPTADQRQRLRDVLADYVRRHDLRGPLALEELSAHVGRAIDQADPPVSLPDDDPRFAVVVLHNETIRDQLAAVPFRRRLLMLPRCLRDADHCPGQMDELGLLCARCGRCHLDEIQRQADRLGYVTVVAEGTAVVSSLLATGKIEAIVGVSCLEMLAKLFPAVRAAGIPAVAVPLLYNGCVDTDVDIDWLAEVLELSEPSTGPGLDLDALRAEVADLFTPARLDALLGPAESPAERTARQAILAGGKRWRPLLACCAYHALADDAGDADDLPAVAVAVECFHKASLVHDDIEDDDATRYDQPTLHVAHGLPIALNTGDLLLGEGYRLLASASVDGDRRARLCAIAADAHRRLCVGQGAELDARRTARPLTPADVIDIFRGKTAPAFEVALRLGAVLAGADDRTERILIDVSEQLGIAYQIRDDLQDAAGGDLPAGRPSLLWSLAWQRADASRRDRLKSLSHLPADRQAAEARALLAETASADAAGEMLRTAGRQALQSLAGLDDTPLSSVLGRVIARILADAERLVCPPPE
jgi:geranylgeranyl pyrophosphate synthase